MDASGEPEKENGRFNWKVAAVGAIAVLIVVSVLLVYWASPTLSILPTSEDSDGDGVLDESDAFPLISTQWSDLDKDGFGDNLNGITPDRFPQDYTQWFDFDRDGYGDNPDGLDPDDFPADPTQWSDADNDGHGDNPNGSYPDAFPFNSEEWRDADGDMHGDNSDAYPNNPNYWATGNVVIFVEIVSRHGHEIAYGVYVNGQGSADGYLDPRESAVERIEFSIPYGRSNNFTLDIRGESMGLNWDTTTDFTNIIVEPDMTYFVRLTL